MHSLLSSSMDNTLGYGLYHNLSHIKGNLDTINMEEALCAGFKEQPDICKTWFNIDGGKITVDLGSASFWITLIIFILIIAIAIFLIFWFYRKKIK